MMHVHMKKACTHITCVPNLVIIKAKQVLMVLIPNLIFPVIAPIIILIIIKICNYCNLNLRDF